mmetsp:Transcript_46940/g.135725  ORF Transcript_46940/g.135725 Transcript_46940/m.135725 type:complete len:200 (-) Transcript_46940:214-813(-)
MLRRLRRRVTASMRCSNMLASCLYSRAESPASRTMTPCLRAARACHLNARTVNAGRRPAANSMARRDWLREGETSVARTPSPRPSSILEDGSAATWPVSFALLQRKVVLWLGPTLWLAGGLDIKGKRVGERWHPDGRAAFTYLAADMSMPIKTFTAAWQASKSYIGSRPKSWHSPPVTVWNEAGLLHTHARFAVLAMVL